MDATPKKTYTVTLHAQCLVVIEAENEDEAGLTAMNETPLSAFSVETGDQIEELTGSRLESYKRTADHFIPA